jgi:3-oxoacyl-[acyl-carrier-protein] synthase-1
VDDAGLDCVMSNSFGFGGTNASLAFKRLAP